MDHVAAELKLPPWMEPAALTGFLDELREAGYNVGTAQYISAHDLVVALVARGEDLAAPARFRSFLGPLICRSPREQEEFRTVFDQWVGRLDPGAGDGAAERRVGEKEVRGELRKVGKRSRLWMLWIGLLTLLLVGFFLYLRAPSSAPVEPPPIVEEAPQPSLPAWEAREILAGLLVVLLLTLIAWRLWWRYRAHLFLVRLATTDDPRIERLPVRVTIDELFEKHFLLRTIQGFRQRFEVPSGVLDLERTIQATMRNGGWFSPAFGTRSVTPEYLVLIDRASHHDQQARLIEELVEKLEKSHVFVSRWYFDGDPRLCFPASERELPLTLAELRAKHPEHRLLLFTDASGLFDFGIGEPAPWVEQLMQWKQRALLTPRPIEQWRQRELTLRSHLMVLPATAEGLAHLSRIFNSERPHALQTSAAPSLMPEDLRLRPQRWLSRDAPEDRLVERVMGDLEQFLGDAGFYWLSACAVYPELSWDLVLFLGNKLRTEKGERLLTAERLAVLGQLPWFRNGYMPDWLRLRLVGAMPREREQAVRDLLTNLLLSTLAGIGHDFYLEIAQRDRRTLSRLMRKALDVLARRSPEESPLKDHVFRDFMAGRRKRRLAFRLPELIAALFSDSGATLSPIEVRARQATKATLLTSLACFAVVIVVSTLAFLEIVEEYWPGLAFWVFISVTIVIFLEGITFKRTMTILTGALEIMPIFVFATLTVPNIGWLSVALLGVFVVAIFAKFSFMWRERQRKLPSSIWRFRVTALTIVLAWVVGFANLYYVTYHSKDPDITGWAIATLFSLSGLGLFLAIMGYVEKNVWLCIGGIIQMATIPALFTFESSWSAESNSRFMGSVFALSVVTTLVFLIQSWRQNRRSIEPVKISAKRQKAA